MKETDIMRQMQITGSKAGSRLFRNNTGQPWVGKGKLDKRTDSITLTDARPFHAGLCKGSSDLIGFTPTVVTAEMVGNTVAVFTAVEVKTAKGKASSAQESFISAVKSAGGLAGVARNDEDLIDILRKNCQGE